MRRGRHRRSALLVGVVVIVVAVAREEEGKRGVNFGGKLRQIGRHLPPKPKISATWMTSVIVEVDCATLTGALSTNERQTKKYYHNIYFCPSFEATVSVNIYQYGRSAVGVVSPWHNMALPLTKSSPTQPPTTLQHPNNRSESCPAYHGYCR